MEPTLPAPEARAPPALPEHILEEILVLIRDTDDLTRATAACKTFCRLINHPTFLRRYRSLHPPLLLGLEGPGMKGSFLPVEAPHPNALTAGALAAAISFDHLPERETGWLCCDVRNGRFLVMCCTLDPNHDLAGNEGRLVVLLELGLCDPVTQEFTLLPPVPAGLLASTKVKVQDGNEFIYPFFDPSACYDDEAQFRVICWTLAEEMAAVLVYSSASGSWTRGVSATWAALNLDVQPGELSCVSGWPSYAYGCLYWLAGVSDDLIKLDVNSMEISTVALPSDHEDSNHIVLVEAGEGKIGMFTRIHSHPWHLRYSIRQNVSGDPNEASVRTEFILLPREYDIYCMDGVAQGYLFLRGQLSDDPSQKTACFSLEIKTLKLERLGLSYYTPDRIIPYFGFPPFIHR